MYSQQMSNHRNPARRRRPARGLAMLELVMALPILLLIMALMINYGTVACWKVRALSVARHAAWASRDPRNFGADPWPDYWPDNSNNWPNKQASRGAGGAGSIPELDNPDVWPSRLLPAGPSSSGATINAGVLDPTAGLHQGTSDLHANFPLLAKLGAYALHAKNLLLDDKWPFWRMYWHDKVWHDGFSDNIGLRIPVLYTLAQAPAELSNAYVQAAMAIYNASFRQDLAPLDRDDEFIYYDNRFPLLGIGVPDFHPRFRCLHPCSECLRRCCSLDKEETREDVDNLIDRIQGKDNPHLDSLAETMARAFIRMYQRVIDELNRLMSATPPPPPDQMGSMQAEIAQLQQKIDILQKFLDSLR